MTTFLWIMAGGFILGVISLIIFGTRKKSSQLGLLLSIIISAVCAVCFVIDIAVEPVKNINGIAESGTSFESVTSEEKDDASVLFSEIRTAYKNNELSADDTYKGNRYTIIGEFDGVSEDGIFNKILGEINVTVKIMDGETTCYAFCGFSADKWRDKLAALNKGDEMIIEGECHSWGSWSDCKLR